MVPFTWPTNSEVSRTIKIAATPGTDMSGLALDLYPPLSPRFSQQGWRDHKPFFLGRTHGRANPHAAKQAAAKRARKITRRSRP